MTAAWTSDPVAIAEAQARAAGVPPGRRFELTDAGNGERFAHRHGSVFRFDHDQGRWLRSDGRRWALDACRSVVAAAIATARSMYSEAAGAGRDEAARLAAHAHRSESAGRLKAMLELASVNAQIARCTRDFDRDPMLLNVANGTVDLRTGEMYAARQGDLLTKLAPVAFDPAVTCPTWIAFLTWAFRSDTEVLDWVKQICGYTLTGRVDAQAWFFLHGQGRNGKTTFLEALERILGDYATRAMPDLLLAKALDQHPTELADLQGSRMVLCIEPDLGRRFRDGLLKALTGESRLKARRMHRDPFTFDVTSKLFVAANYKPEVRDASDGFWRRVQLVPFEAQVEDGDANPVLGEKLHAEAPGILAWCVQGCLAWQQLGALLRPASVAGATQAYRDEQDHLRRFVDEACLVAPRAWAASGAVFAEYTRWCARSGEEPLSRLLFAQLLERQAGICPRRTKTARGWQGLAVRSQVTGDA